VASPRRPHYSCARDIDKTPNFTRAKGNKKKPSDSGKKHIGNEETKRKKENNNGIAGVPPLVTQPM